MLGYLAGHACTSMAETLDGESCLEGVWPHIAHLMCGRRRDDPDATIGRRVRGGVSVIPGCKSDVAVAILAQVQAA